MISNPSGLCVNFTIILDLAARILFLPAAIHFSFSPFDLLFPALLPWLLLTDSALHHGSWADGSPDYDVSWLRSRARAVEPKTEVGTSREATISLHVRGPCFLLD
ncbi:hypothetical protein IF2G_01388 [Cordyceps javanica]|nr:hypothetical protein IF2G_01388 [Cordyceps javanica]